MSRNGNRVTRRTALKGIGTAAAGALSMPVVGSAGAQSPVNLSVADISGTDVTVTWDDIGAQQYYLYWRNATTGDSDGGWRQSTSETIGLSSGTTYDIWVGADDGSSFEWHGPVRVLVPRDESEGFISDVEQSIHEEINARRQRNGLETVTLRDDISDVARGHSQWQADNDELTHVQSDGTGPGDRLEAAGISCLRWAENVLYNYSADDSPSTAAQTTVDQWMNSAGHRENILTPEFTVEGVGVVTTATGQLWATQLLGTDC